MVAKDVRIQTTSEVINGMKVIKLQAWEKAFLEKLTGIRNEEVKVLRKYLSMILWIYILDMPFGVQSILLFGTLFPYWSRSLPLLRMLMVLEASILRYTLTGNTLDYSIAFTALSLYIYNSYS